MLYIQDRADSIVGQLNNVYNDEFHAVLAQGLSSYTFTISKNEEFSEDVKIGNYVILATDDGMGWQGTIAKVNEDHLEKTVYCEDIGLSLINKTASAWDMPAVGMTIDEYIEKAVGNTGWHVGFNQLDPKLSMYSWTDNDTALNRILDIAVKFGAELEFAVTFESLKVTHRFINIYKHRGTVRSDVQLVYGNNVKDVQKESNILELATALKGVGSEKEQKGYDINKEDPNKFSIVYTEGYGVLAVDKDGNQIPDSNKRFLANTTWDVLGFKQCGQFACIQASSTEYIPINVTNHANITINYLNNYGVNAWDKNGNMINGTNSKFKAGTKWKVTAIYILNGSRVYQVSSTEFIPVIYTQFGEGRTSKDYWNFADLEYDDGDYFSPKGNPVLYARTANGQFNYADEYIEQEFKVETSSPQLLLDKTLEELKTKSVAKLTYVVELAKLDPTLNLGDEIRIIDHDYKPALYLSARLSEVTRHFDGSIDKDTAVFTNFVEVQSSIDQRLKDLENQFKNPPQSDYIWIRFADDDQGTGISATPDGKSYIAIVHNSTTETPSDNPADYAGMWVRIKGIDGENGIAGKPGADGKTPYFHTAWADSSDGKTGFSVSTAANKSYMGTYSNFIEADSYDPTDYTWVLIKGKDGDKGIAGDPGADGKTPYFHTAWANSATGSIGFSVSDSSGKSYMGTYTDFTEKDSTLPWDYTWVKIKGEDGANGEPGENGTFFHTAWADSADGSVGFSVSAVTGKKYMGTYTDKIEADSTDYKKYTWIKIKGEDGANGVPGENGTFFHTAWANSADGSVGFSVSVSTGKTYMGTYTDKVVADSTSYTRYSWVKIKGDNGANGTPGAPGTDGKTTYFHVAYANNSTGTSGFSTTDATGKSYMGTYTDFNVADSLQPSMYTWVKIKGDDGADGDAGNIPHIYVQPTTPTTPTPKKGDIWWKTTSASVTATVIGVFYHNGYTWFEKEIGNDVIAVNIDGKNITGSQIVGNTIIGGSIQGATVTGNTWISSNDGTYTTNADNQSVMKVAALSPGEISSINISADRNMAVRGILTVGRADHKVPSTGINVYGNIAIGQKGILYLSNGTALGRSARSIEAIPDSKIDVNSLLANQVRITDELNVQIGELKELVQTQQSQIDSLINGEGTGVSE